MNYIKHLTGFFEKVSIDFDLNPTHISLYMAVFQLWNQNRFQNPIGISRDELMRISKIASTATYHKCMKELTEKGYVKYKPSFNPFKGSTLDVINLDFYTKPIQKKEIKKLKSQQKNEQVIEQVTEQLINKHQTSTEHVPYINNTNNLNIVNEQVQKNQNQNQNCESEKACTELGRSVEDFDNKKRLRQKKENELVQRIPPDLEDVVDFFKKQDKPFIEAEKFYNHFQSNGWLVGGKSPMKDWKAAARNWIINADKFNNKNRHPELVEGPKPNHLHTSNNKNYGEPL
jgi:hypothetical protein